MDSFIAFVIAAAVFGGAGYYVWYKRKHRDSSEGGAFTSPRDQEYKPNKRNP